MINERPLFGRFYEMDLLQTSYNVRFTNLEYRNICISILISTTRDSRYSYVYTRLPETSWSLTKSFHISRIRNRYLPLVTRKDDKEEDGGKERKESRKQEKRQKGKLHGNVLRMHQRDVRGTTRRESFLKIERNPFNASIFDASTLERASLSTRLSFLSSL